MLKQVTEGVLVHESAFLQSNSIVVRGQAGALVIDPGLTATEMTGLAEDLRKLGDTIVAGFSTHPDWDHALWHASLGEVPRFGTARCAAFLQELLSHADWKERVTQGLPPEFAEEIPVTLFGRITGLPSGTRGIPWNGPLIQVIEHQAHAPGHAALLIEDQGVLVAGDMLSDVLMPILDLDALDPIGDYLATLSLLESMAADIVTFIPGHGSVGDTDELQARVALDRAYVEALRDGIEPDDPRIGPSAPLEWLPEVHRLQVAGLTRRMRGGKPA